MEVHSWAWIFFISFVLLASLLVINVLIAIIINAMEDAREAEQREERKHLIDGPTRPVRSSTPTWRPRGGSRR